MPEIYGMKHGFAEDEIQERSVVGLDDEKEDLFERYVEQLWANYHVLGVAPDVVANEIRIPRCRRDHCDLCPG